MNVAYTKEYQNWRKQRMSVFRPEYLCPRTEKIKLNTETGAFILKVRYYKDKNQNSPQRGSECELQGQRGEVFYRWYNIDNNAEFYRLIEHSDGNDYLIFRQDLYGYSVLNLQTMQDLQCPSPVFPIWKGGFRGNLYLDGRILRTAKQPSCHTRLFLGAPLFCGCARFFTAIESQ